MTYDPTRGRPPVLGQIDGGQPPFHGPLSPTRSHDPELSGLLRQLLAGQDKQNGVAGRVDRSGRFEPAAKDNGTGAMEKGEFAFSANCHRAAKELSKVQAEFLENLTREIGENFDNLVEGEFMLTEFIDRFGPRMAHLNGILQVLSQLSAVPNPATRQNSP